MRVLSCLLWHSSIPSASLPNPDMAANMTDLDFHFHRGPVDMALLQERTLYSFYPDQLCETSTFEELSDKYPRLTIEDLSDHTNERACSICTSDYQAKYLKATDGEEADTGEQPIRLSCGHIFGHDCIDRWRLHNSCPICRKQLLEGVADRDNILVIDLEDAGFLRDIELARQLMSGLGLEATRQLLLDDDEELNRDREERFLNSIQQLDQHAGNFNLPARQVDDLEMARARAIPFASLLRGPRQEALHPSPTIPRPPHQSIPNQPILVDSTTRTSSINPATQTRQREQTRLTGSRRDYLLYSRLRLSGLNMPGPHVYGPGLEQTLDAAQNEALFEHLTAQGAFHYPQMDEIFQHPHPRTDREVLACLREMGLFWQPFGAWEMGEGGLVFLSGAMMTLDREWRRERGVDSVRGMGGDEEGGAIRARDDVGVDGAARRRGWNLLRGLRARVRTRDTHGA